jgi:hypothetical protein
MRNGTIISGFPTKILSVLLLINHPKNEDVLGEWSYSSALDGGEWSASRSGRLPPGKELPVATG